MWQKISFRILCKLPDVITKYIIYSTIVHDCDNNYYCCCVNDIFTNYVRQLVYNMKANFLFAHNNRLVNSLKRTSCDINAQTSCVFDVEASKILYMQVLLCFKINTPKNLVTKLPLGSLIIS